jgi:hypothetical protein
MHVTQASEWDSTLGTTSLQEALNHVTTVTHVIACTSEALDFFSQHGGNGHNVSLMPQVIRSRIK